MRAEVSMVVVVKVRARSECGGKREDGGSGMKVKWGGVRGGVRVVV